MTDDDGQPEERGDGAPPSDSELEDARKIFGPTEFHNVEAEAALLGALMIDNRLVADISERLKPEDFHEPIHADVYKTIVRLVGNSKQANPVTLRPLFALDTRMKELGGPAYLAQLTGSGAAMIGAFDFAEQIIELKRMREIYEAMISTVRGFQNTGDIAGSIDRLEQKIWEAADRSRPMRIHTAGGMFKLVQKRHDRIALTATASIGAISRTIPEINSMIGGMEGGQVTILAGRPSMGKTTTAISYSWGCAANGHPTLYCHAEMSDELMALKVATDICYSLGTPIEFKRVKEGKLNAAEQRMLDEAKAQAELLPLRYADTGRADTMRLEAAIARQCAYWESQGRKLELVVIDHMGLVGVKGVKQGDTFTRVSIVSKWLQDMATKYGVHMLALCQLSRKVEDRVATDRRPQLSDLRDSGDIEQDADNVLFVHRPEFYLPEQKPKATSKTYERDLIDWQGDMAEWEDKAEIIAGKNRLGERGSRRIRFYGSYSAARSLTHRRDNDDDDDGATDMFNAKVGQ